MTNFLVATLVLSLGGNAYLLFKLHKLKTDPGRGYDALDLLADMRQGGALFKVERIDPRDVLLRSPRDLA